MRIRPPEPETSICDVKYHASLGISQQDNSPTPSLHLERRPSLSHTTHRPSPLAPPTCRRLRGWTCSDHRNEEIPFVPNSSGLLVQADEGVMFPVMDLIKEDLPPPTLKSQIPYEFGWSQKPRCQQDLVGGHLKTMEMTIKDIEDRRSVKPEAIVIGLHCILHFT
ncbi:mechanosensitive ion channel protein 9-like [Dorcoceras hygrometricum]|uniref:Mechanosensitive ion channel protein 9-like n=1 Tax=Dorcoceras hygrometricum TaxID=472368 RepID=A0A2Z7DJL1_9LAMI|nr:mechanosensitive ion channel protein 9-like [Dorcoceras hygrometricum]